MNALRLGASRLAPITARVVGESLERQVCASKSASDASWKTF